MNEQNQVKQARVVFEFDRVAVRDFGRLVITQGEDESLIIEADADLISKVRADVSEGQLTLGVETGWVDKLSHAIAATLIRKPVTYTLVVKELKGLDIVGGALVEAADISAEELSIRVSGAGSIKFRSLEAQSLKIELRGTGKIEVDGRAQEQQVILSGAGVYQASDLETAKTSVSLTGAGSATVRATETLDVIHRGLGKVGYYGSPTITKNVTGLGSVNPLGE